jgi:O-antigen/teichoic acid export membrane protein
MLVVLAKNGSPEMVGRFALALGMTAPILLLSSLQLRAVQATDARERFHFGQYLALRLLTTAAALVVCAVAAVVGTRTSDDALVILLIALAKCVDSVSDVLYGFFQRHETMRTIAVSMMWKGLISMGALWVVVVATRSLVCASAAVALASTTTLLAYDLPRARSLGRSRVSHSGVRPEWTSRPLCRLLALSLPLGFVMCLVSLNANLPRYVIEYHLGARQLGIFAAVSCVASAGTMVVSAVGQAASPRLANYFALGRKRAFLNLTGKLLVMGAAFGLCGIAVAAFAGAPLLALLYRPEYTAGAWMLTALLGTGAISWMASFMGYALTAAGCFRPQIPIAVLSLAATAATSFYLAPRLGLTGVVAGIWSGNIAQALASAWALWRTVRAHQCR